ncbi:hypothetical protein Tco_1562320 [Tanacetum coccineum]
MSSNYGNQFLISSPKCSLQVTVKESADAEITSMIDLRVSDSEKEAKELKQVDHSTTLLSLIRSEVPSAVNEYLGSSLGDTLQKELPEAH